MTTQCRQLSRQRFRILRRDHTRRAPRWLLSGPAVGFAVAMSVAGACSQTDGSGRAEGTQAQSGGGVIGVITDVIDGDTVAVELAEPFNVIETVRLLGIDTPEKPGGPRPPECGGSSASAFTNAAIPAGTTVLLARDRETRDVYGRLLAWVIRASDGANINLAVVEAGHATALSIAPNNALRSEVSGAADRARRNKRGFWSECGGLPYPLAEGS